MDSKRSSDLARGTALELPRAVWIAMAVYAAVLTALGIDRYATYHSGVDLGLFTQAILDWAHGMRNQTEGASHFLVHFSPLLFLATPFMLAVRSPIVLIALQALAGALTAPAIYLLARRHMDRGLAVWCATITLLYPPLVGVTFTDFHELGFAPASVAWLLWAVDARRFGWAAIFAATTLAIKEDQALLLAALGAGYALWSFRRGDLSAARFGAALGIVSALVFGAFFIVARPLAGAHGSWNVLNYYTGAWPDAARGWGAVWGRLTFLLEALGPLLFVPLLSRWFVLAVPGLIEVLASRWSITYTMGQHYAGVWIAYVLAAFVFALAGIARRDRPRAEKLAKSAATVCLLVLIVASPTHWGHFLRLRTAHDATLDRVIAQVPADASVGAVDELYVHLSLNPNARPGFDGHPEYLVVDDMYDSPTWRGRYKPQLDALLASGDYALVEKEDGVRLYRERKNG
jgi:uncharacterized membrane protein